MKKILIMQAKGNSIGGIWYVYETLAKTLISSGYEVCVLSFRQNPGPIMINLDQKFKMHTINEKDEWEITRFTDIKNSIKKFQIIKTIKLIIKKIIEETKFRIDTIKTQKYIKKLSPNYIICAHYQLLQTIPKKYLQRTIYHQHTSFSKIIEMPKLIKTLNKYKNKIYSFLWLTKSTCDEAIKSGYKNSTYIYNPIKFISPEIADVINNKKLITISRLNSPEKEIKLMLEIAEDILSRHKDWTFELYGEEILDDECMKIIDNNSQIKLMGVTKKVKEKLLGASLYLSTSSFEGFPLSVIEAYECGIPCIAYNYGESCKEQIINNKTGFVLSFKDKSRFIEKTEELINNNDKLIEFSKNAKEFARKFNVLNIINEWKKLFDKLDDEVNKNEN